MLNQGHEQIALKDEIDHVRQYLLSRSSAMVTSYSMRLKRMNLSAIINCLSWYFNLYIENAIYHGIKEIDRPGIIRDVDSRRRKAGIVHLMITVAALIS